MVKKVCLLLVLIILATTFAACNLEHNVASNSPPSSDTALQTEGNQNGDGDTEDIMISDDGLVSFSSEEALIKYIKSSEKSTDVAKIKELQEYYLLKNIPEGYKLYKITVGSFDVGFWYLPDSRLSSATTISEAESANEYYMLISPRKKLRLSEVLAQFGLSKDTIVADKYYYKETPNPKLIWEHDDHVMILYLPKNQESVNLENVEKLCDLSKKTPLR